MKLSVIIVTYNRPKDVSAVLASISAQSLLPAEILIVDNSPDSGVFASLEESIRQVAQRGIEVKQLKNPVNSLPAARNLAVRNSKGDILLFLDDDVILEPGYISEIIKIYTEIPEAKGVQGYIVDESSRNPIREFLHRIFFWYHEEVGQARVLPSCSTTYPKSPAELIWTEWLSGANHSYRRDVFDHEWYDENLLKYADGEDLDMSYRVYKRFPGSLFLTPKARLEHKTSSSGRAIGRELAYMREVYGLYLFYKLFPDTFVNKMIYVWSRFGRFIFSVINVLRNPSRSMINEVLYVAGAYGYCFKKSNFIKVGRLSFFNQTLSGLKRGI